MFPYTVILLDADETLFDFRRAEEFALSSTFNEYDLGPASAAIDRFREINRVVWKEYEDGISTPDVIRTKRFVLLLEAIGASADAQALSDSYIGHLSQAGFLIPGATELLEVLSRRAALVMLTNGLSKVQRSRISMTRVAEYFTDIVISEEVGIQKPDPEIFRIAVARGMREQGDGDDHPAALMIGDNLHSDIGGAVNAGLDTCWVNLHHRANDSGLIPTFTVTTLTEIPTVIGL